MPAFNSPSVFTLGSQFVAISLVFAFIARMLLAARRPDAGQGQKQNGNDADDFGADREFHEHARKPPSNPNDRACRLMCGCCAEILQENVSGRDFTNG